MRQTLQVAVLLMMTALFGWSQNVGAISGTVTDQANAVLPNANVTVSNQATGVTVAVKTNAEGAFVVTPLNPATYKISVEASGFRTYNQENVVLNLNDRIGLPPIVMQVGATGDSITVPVGEATLGRIFNVIGKPLDPGEAVGADVSAAFHARGLL